VKFVSREVKITKPVAQHFNFARNNWRFFKQQTTPVWYHTLQVSVFMTSRECMTSLRAGVDIGFDYLPQRTTTLTLTIIPEP